MINSISRDKCCGCEACVQACAIRCIDLVEDDEGFLFPKIDIDRCIKCNRCEKVCPVVNQTPKIKPKAGYAYRTKDESLLLKTSSGGFFTAWAFMSRYEALEILPLMMLTFAFFAICRIFTWKKLFIDSIWFIAGIMIGVFLVALLFGVPIEFFTEPFYAKINRTLL
jgi:ferredoxin